jgi:putative nucleotidyltransferase with HDIG domain
MISLAVLSEGVDKLDPMPISLPKLAEALADTGSNLRDMVRIVEYDAALTANTIRWANSAAYAPRDPILTVRDAIMRLGAGRVLQLAVGGRVKALLGGPCPGYDLGEKELWNHSVTAALGADLLSRFARQSIPPVAFTAALLHDIGKLIISRQISREMHREIVDVVDRENLPFFEAERVVLGVSHAEIGGVVAKRWSFPDILVDCIRLHHDPDDESHISPALDAVHIGNVVAKSLGVGMGSEQMNMVACANSARRLGLTPEKFEALCANVMTDLPMIEELFDGSESRLKAHYPR